MTPEVLTYIIIGGAVLFGIIGAVAGIIKQISSVAALVLGIVAGRMFGDEIAAEFGMNEFLAAALLAVVVYIIVILLAKALKKTAHALALGPIDRLMGAIVGMVMWLTLLSLILNLIALYAPEAEFMSSGLAQWVLEFLPMIIGCASTYI